MNLIKYKHFNPVSLERLFDEFSGRNIPNLFGSNFVSVQPSVNIVEHEGSFDIEVAAPGLTKEDFVVELEKDQLMISAKKESASEENEDDKFARREFNYSSFKRSFYLSEDISQDEISAKYENGILTIHLAKSNDARDVKKTVEIE